MIIQFILVILLAIAALFTPGGGFTGGRDVVKDLRLHPRSKSEAAVIRFLEEITHAKFPTVNPDWLLYHGKTLELDGYNARLRIALEFSGPLHTKWAPADEPYEAYFSRVMKDMVKKKMCERNNVRLMVVDYSLPRAHWRNYVLSRLYDYGVVEKPVDYILEQIAEPFRNPSLERELGLDAEVRYVESM